MNLTVKRYLLGLIASATMFGIARAQDDEPAGAVQLGPKARVPIQYPAEIQQTQQDVPVQMDDALPPGMQQFSTTPMPPASTFGPPGQSGPVGQPAPYRLSKTGSPGNTFQMTPVDQVIPRFYVNSYGGGLYGYGSGYASGGAFVPYKIDDTAILFAAGQGMVTYDGKGGGSVGAGWRYFMEDLDRIVGLSAWFDFDNGHYQPYQQLGLSFESLGRYVDYRVNGYVPVSTADHYLVNNVTSTAVLNGSVIALLTNNTVEQSYSGFDAEVGGPTPILGRYGLNAYVGGYSFSGNGTRGGNFQGVSARLLTQINEDVSLGFQVTDDHTFGLNTQFQAFVNLPSGKPSRWFRSLKVQDRMMQNVFRQYRVAAKIESFTSYTAAINPNTHQPYFVASINPNATVNGTGTAANPFNSIAAYEALTPAQQQRYSIILVQPRTDGTSTNLDTSSATQSTFNVYNGQSFLSTTVPQKFAVANLGNELVTLPGQSTGADPILINSTGGNVVTLVGGNTFGQQVSGFQIVGSTTGNGIFGNNNLGANISNDNINSSLNGVLLQNLSGTIAAGTEAQFFNNTIQGNYGNGIQVTNHAAAPLDVVVQNNTFSSNGVVTIPKGTTLTDAEQTFINNLNGTITTLANGNVVATIAGSDGLQLNALAGSSISGIIGGPNTAATATTPEVTLSNTFTGNSGNGLSLIANGGILNFSPPVTAPPTTTTTTTTTTTADTTPVTTLFGIVNGANGIYNNTFTANTLDGLHISTTNNSKSTFTITNNTFGAASDAVVNTTFGTISPTTEANGRYGIGLVSTSGTTLITIGGASTTDPITGVTTSLGNSFFATNTSTLTPGDAINLSVSGTAALTYNVTNNILSSSYTSNAAPADDKFTFTIGANGAAPFSLIDQSTTTGAAPAAEIKSMSWDLASSAAVFAGTSEQNVTGNAVFVQPPAGDTLLTSVNNFAVKTGQNPLTLAGAGALLANDTNLGLPANGQSMKLGFNSANFTTGTTFTATTLLDGPKPPNGAAPVATPAQINGSTVLVTFSDGRTALATVNGGVATGDVTTPLTTGYGTASDGIHVVASGSSNVNTSTIEGNTVTGFGKYGIQIETAGSAKALDVIIEKNTLQFNGTGSNTNGTPTFTGGGIDIASHDSSMMNAFVESNIITSNFNNGLTILADGTGSVLHVTSSGNTNTGNAGNGLLISTAGGAVLTFTTTEENLTANGIGAGTNTSPTGSDDIAITTAGTSVANLNFIDVLANNSSGNGLSASTNDTSTLNLSIDTVASPTFTGTSSFSNNQKNGLLLASNGDSLLHATINDTTASFNALNGLEFDRAGASLIHSTITNTIMSNNGSNGFYFHGLGSDPQNPNQQQSGTPSMITMSNDTLTLNGNFNTGAGQGARFDMLGDSELLFNANATTFSNNAENGVRIEVGPGAQFGYIQGGKRSTFDNDTFNNNGLNGLMATSLVSPSQNAPVSTTPNNPFNPPDAASTTYMQISSNTGNTQINDNAVNGIMLQYPGGNHDILVQGDTNAAAPNFTTVIQGNVGDGIHSESADDGTGNGVGVFLAETSVTLTVNNVLIGGPVAANANGGNGIDFEAQTVLHVIDKSLALGYTNYIFGSFVGLGGGAGEGTLNVNSSTIEGNGLNGILLLGNALQFNGLNADGTFAPRVQSDRAQEGWGQLQANISNSTITLNKADGIEIELLGYMGEFRQTGVFGANAFVLNNNVISNNGEFGVFMEQNVTTDVRNDAGNPDFFSVLFNDPQPTNPPEPFNPLNLFGLDGFIGNEGYNSPIKDQEQLGVMSNWMNLETAQNSTLVMTSNTIQHNGTQSNPNFSDGVFIRVGTDTYLSADIRNNTVSGNIGNDFHFESFDSYNPVTGVAAQPLGSAAHAAPTLDLVVLDDTAQMDLRFTGNTGNTVNFVNPYDFNSAIINGQVGGALPGNTTPNGAVYEAEGLKDNFSFAFPSPRLVQLFEVDNGPGLNASNNFTQSGVTTDINAAFFNADFALRSSASFVLDNPLFPQFYAQSPGNPFLP